MAELARSILLVDDDEVFRHRLARAFRDRGWDVSEGADMDGALAAAAEETPEFVVVDLRLHRRSLQRKLAKYPVPR